MLVAQNLAYTVKPNPELTKNLPNLDRLYSPIYLMSM
jgi:hypothetical protein